MNTALYPEQETAYMLALSRIQGVGSRTLVPALQQLGSAENLWKAPESLLKTLLTPGYCKRFVDGRATLNPEQLYAPYAGHRIRVNVLGLNDPDYPALLRESYAPPLVLYVRGDVRALHGRNLAVVGTRNITDYGQQVTGDLIGAMRSARPCIVSGLAYGVDALAHATALQHGLPTAAVLGSGIDILSPAGNRGLAERILSTGGCILSEYPLGVQATTHTFPERNRIVAALSHGTLVIEGALKSGALITARAALEEGRSVFAVPGNIYAETSQGPLRLIRDGATPVMSASDILTELAWSVGPLAGLSGASALSDAPALPDDLSEAERTILQGLSAEPVMIESLQRLTGFSMASLSEQLTMLELDGHVVSLPGGRVRRKA